MKPYKIGIAIPGLPGMLAYWVEGETETTLTINNRAKGIWNSQTTLSKLSDGRGGYSRSLLQNFAGQRFEIRWSDERRVQGVQKAKESRHAS